MKTYRSRNLSIRCQIAKDDGTGNPLKDEKGHVVLDHGSLWFYKISGSDAHDNKRLIPVDHQAFFAQKSKEVLEALQAEGITDVQVTPEDLYQEYVSLYSKPGKTFAPAGHPEEFTIVLPKQLCVNFVGGGPSLGGVNKPAVPAAQSLSIFARIRAAREQASQQAPVNSNPLNRKAKVG